MACTRNQDLPQSSHRTSTSPNKFGNMEIPIEFDSADVTHEKTNTDKKWSDLWKSILDKIREAREEGEYDAKMILKYPAKSRQTKGIQTALSEIGYDVTVYEIDNDSCTIKIAWLYKPGKRPMRVPAGGNNAKKVKRDDSKSNKDKSHRDRIPSPEEYGESELDTSETDTDYEEDDESEDNENPEDYPCESEDDKDAFIIMDTTKRGSENNTVVPIYDSDG